MSDGRPTKICPDCAETVLEAASKCRFCGYRFAPAARPATPGGTGGVLSLLRRDAPAPVDVDELLDSWGIPHEDEDAEPAFFNGTIARDFGFIVVTQTRLCFVPATKRSKAVAAREQHLLSDLLRVHQRRHRWRRRLLIEWRDSRTTVALDAAQARRLYELLSPLALVQSPDD